MSLNDPLKSHAKLAKRCRSAGHKISARTIGYMLDVDDPRQPTLGTIVAIAETFRVLPWLLLTPDFNAEQKTGGQTPPPDIIALAERIMRNREALSDVFGEDTITDDELDANGWNAARPSVMQQKSPPYKKTPRQLKMKLK